MTSELVPIRDMTPDQFADFAHEMWLLVAEQAALWEFPLGSMELVEGRRAVGRGPWRWQDCSAALLIWLDAGLLAACHMRPDGSEPDLSYEDAREALLDAEMWLPPTDSGFVSVYEPATGPQEPVQSWLARLQPLRTASADIGTCVGRTGTT